MWAAPLAAPAVRDAIRIVSRPQPAVNAWPARDFSLPGPYILLAGDGMVLPASTSRRRS